MSVLGTGPLSPSGNPGAPRPPPPRPPALGHEVEHDPVVRRLSASGSLDAASNSKALVRRRTTISNCASPEAQEKLIQDLRNEGLQLQRKIDEIVAARSRGGRSDLEDKAQAEQLQAKDQRLVELRQMVNVEKESCDLGMQPLRNQVQDLESEHAALKMELQRAKGGLDQTDVGLLASDVQRAEDGHRQLMSQLDRLQANSFISKTDDRREASRRVVELEDLVQRKAAEHEGLLDASMKAEQSRLSVVQDRQRLEEKCRDLRRRNEQLQMEVESQVSEMRRVEHEMRLMRERLPPDNQEALERALNTMVGDQAAAFSRLERADPAQVPTKQELLSPDSLDRVLERLKREREDLARQIGILRQELDREAATSRNLKSLQIQELEDARLKSRNHLSDREKWERIAAAHLQTFQDLQQRIAAFEDTGSTMAGGRPDDVVSLGGFSDVSDLEGCENALDVFIGQAEVAVDVVERLQAAAFGSETERSAASQPPLSLDKIQTVVCVDLRGFDAGYSAVAAGLRPTYDSLVSFGPFGVDDSLLEHLSTGSLGVEVRASLPGSEEQFVLGRGLMPLAGLLRYAGQDTRNPAAGGVVTIRDPKDQDVLVARCRLKLRLRYSIEELAEDFQHRAKLRQIDKKQLRRGLDPNLGNAPHTLLVRVRRVSGLPPAPRQRPDELRPYVTFQVPGHGPHFTRTGQGPHPILMDEKGFEVRVDDAFCAWVESSGGLHFLVFDDASPQNRVPEATAQGIQALGLVGEVKVSLKPLLHDALSVLEAAFTLSRDLSLLSSGPAVGTLELAICWSDFDAARAAKGGTPVSGGSAAAPAQQQQAAFGGTAVMADAEFQSVLGRLVRRLVAQGLKSVELAFDHLDTRGEGALRREDFLFGLSQMQMGTSDEEASRLFARLDSDGDGVVVLQELRSALAACTQADAPQRAQEEWVRELFTRVRDAMDRRTDMPPMSVFQKLARESGGAGGIDSLRFGRLLRCFRDDLTDDHLRYLWLMVDKDRSGLLTADEFADIFGCTTGILQSAAAPAAPRAPLTEEYFGILCGRLLRYLRSRGLQTLEEVIRRYDADGDGRVSKAELEAALTQDAPNLSQPERTQFIARLDADNDGVISAAELQLAFSVGEGLHGQSEKRALEMFSRIRAAITRSSQTPNQVFAGLCRGQPSMSQVLFEQLVKGFCPDLEPVHVQLMWQLVDKNNDGSIVFEEFVRYFGAQSPAVTQMPARPQPPPIDTSASPSRPPPPAPGAAVAMPQAPRDKLLLESIRRLIAKHGKQPAQFFQGMDVNRDGKLSAEEFAAGLIGLGVGEERSELRKFFLQIPGAVMGRLPIDRLSQAVSGSPAAPPSPSAPSAPRPPPTVVTQPAPPAAPGRALGLAASAAEARGVLTRIAEAIGHQGAAAAERLYRQGSTGRQLMSRAELELLVQSFQQVPAEVLGSMWRSLANDSGAECLTFDAFCSQLCPAALESAPTLSSGKQHSALLYRLSRGLNSRGLTVHKALGPFDPSGAGASLSLEELLQAVSSSGGLGLSRLEIERTFEKLAQRAPALPGAAAPQRLQLQTLEASMRAVPESLAEAQWVRDLTTNVASRAQQSGALLEASFARLGQEAIDAEEVRKEFAKHLSMDSEQWKTVVCFLQKQSDGCVFWREFLRWAGVVKGF